MKVTLLIPTWNEIDGIKAVMPLVKREWVDEVIVIDAGSTDGTREYFEKLGYRILDQKGPGLMWAWMEGNEAASGDVIIWFTPDNNSVPDAIPQLIEKMKEGYDMVVASRYKDGAKSYEDDFFSGWANYFFNKIINFLFRTKATDALVIYRAFKKNLPKELGFTAKTATRFNIFNCDVYQIILNMRCAKLKKKMAEIPADEPDRLDGTKGRAHPTLPIKSYNGLLFLYNIAKERLIKRPKD